MFKLLVQSRYFNDELNDEVEIKAVEVIEVSSLSEMNVDVALNNLPELDLPPGYSLHSTEIFLVNSNPIFTFDDFGRVK